MKLHFSLKYAIAEVQRPSLPWTITPDRDVTAISVPGLKFINRIALAVVRYCRPGKDRVTFDWFNTEAVPVCLPLLRRCHSGFFFM